MTRFALRSVLPGFALACLIAPTLAAQSAEDLFERGVKAFRRGENAEAVESFRAALAGNPGGEEVFALWQKVDQQTVLDMLLEDGELGQLTERFLGLARVGREAVLSDPGGADEVVARVFEGDLVARQHALVELKAGYGEWAVPALVPALADRADSDRRVKAMAALLQLGELAVPPLVATLNSDDELVRSNAAAVLGSLRDPRAAAHLAWLATSDASETVRGTAASALGKMASDLDALGFPMTDPITLSYGLSELWVHGEAALARPYAQGHVAWTWRDGKLSGTSIPGGLYGLHMAESALSMGVASGADELRPALAAVHASQKAELRAASEMDGLDSLSDVDAQLAAIEIRLALAGSARADALLFLLDTEGGTSAAIALAESMGNSPEETAALRVAVESDDAGLSQAAALALGEKGEASPDVAAQLADAITAVPVRLAAFIGRVDAGDTPSGWKVSASEQLAEGLSAAKSFPPKDLIVVREGTGGVSLDTLVWSLRNDPRSVATPIVVLSDDADRVDELYGNEVLVQAEADWNAFRAAAGDRPTRQRDALERARAAAEQLLTLPRAVAATAASSVVQALNADLDEPLHIALLDVVVHAEITAAAPQVEALVAGGVRGELGVAALNALASIWAAQGGADSVSPDLLKVLEGALAGGDADLALAAARALGQRGASYSG